MEPSASTHPKVFISYSHDSREHNVRALKLSDQLRHDGIDCHIDQYEMAPRGGWSKWTLDQIEDARFVLVVFTETYNRRLRGRETPDRGQGARFEGAIITQEIYENMDSDKFIPVLFSPEDVQHIPAFLRSTQRYVLDPTVELKFISNTPYEDLYRRLTNQHRHRKPELGELIRLDEEATGKLSVLSEMAPLTVKQNFFDKNGKKHVWEHIRKHSHIYIPSSLVVIIALASLFYFNRPINNPGSPPPPQPPPESSDFNEYFEYERFNPDRWIKPADAKAEVTRDDSYNIESAKTLISPKDLNYTNFEMRFDLKLLNAGGAAWAIRVQEPDKYYLFYLSGPEGGVIGEGFYFYVVKGKDVNPKNYKTYTPKDNLPELCAGCQYNIVVKANGDNIESTIKQAEKPGVGTISKNYGRLISLGVFNDNSYSYGNIGFRTIGAEQFSIDNLFLIPQKLKDKPGP